MTESKYEHIRSLIARNDFVTAEKLMRKYETILTKQEKKELHRFLYQQRKRNKRKRQHIKIDVESEYKRIRSFIAGNDFVSAEKLMRKYDATLTNEEKDKLQRFFAQQQKRIEKIQESHKKNKRERWDIYWDDVLWTIQKILITCFILLLFIIGPYNRLSFLASYQGHTFRFYSPPMEILTLLDIMCIILFIVLEFIRHSIEDGLLMTLIFWIFVLIVVLLRIFTYSV